MQISTTLSGNNLLLSYYTREKRLSGTSTIRLSRNKELFSNPNPEINETNTHYKPDTRLIKFKATFEGAIFETTREELKRLFIADIQYYNEWETKEKLELYALDLIRGIERNSLSLCGILKLELKPLKAPPTSSPEDILNLFKQKVSPRFDARLQCDILKQLGGEQQILIKNTRITTHYVYKSYQNNELYFYEKTVSLYIQRFFKKYPQFNNRKTRNTDNFDTCLKVTAFCLVLKYSSDLGIGNSELLNIMKVTKKIFFQREREFYKALDGNLSNDEVLLPFHAHKIVMRQILNDILL